MACPETCNSLWTLPRTLFHYYKYLSCESFCDGAYLLHHYSGCHSLMPVQKFNLYELHNLAIPDKSGKSICVLCDRSQVMLPFLKSHQYFCHFGQTKIITNVPVTTTITVALKAHCIWQITISPVLWLCTENLTLKSNSSARVQFSKHIRSTAVYLGKGLWTLLVTQPGKSLKLLVLINLTNCSKSQAL